MIKKLSFLTPDKSGAKHQGEVPAGGPAAAVAQATSMLRPGQELLPGESLSSPDGRATLIYQRDGNLVVYGDSELKKMLWASHTDGMPLGRVVMQTDGNLVIYGPRGPLWSSETGGHPGAHLDLFNNGTLRLYDDAHDKQLKSTGGAWGQFFHSFGGLVVEPTEPGSPGPHLVPGAVGKDGLDRPKAMDVGADEPEAKKRADNL